MVILWASRSNGSVSTADRNVHGSNPTHAYNVNIIWTQEMNLQALLDQGVNWYSQRAVHVQV